MATGSVETLVRNRRTPRQSHNHSRVHPPLRWAGSKRSVLPVLALAAPKKYSRYIEPFAGSAALFFFLRPQSAVLGDINQDLISFYRVLAHRPGALAGVITKLDQLGEDYYDLRSLDPSDLFQTSAAARFLYLNRFCFNGVYRTNKEGVFNVPRGNKTGRLPTKSELTEAAKILRTAQVQCADFEQTLDVAKRGDFVYIDPPYFTRKGIKPGEYGDNSLGGSDDVERLIGALNRLSRKGVRYMLSYSPSRRLRELVDVKSIQHISVRRHVGGRRSRRKLAREVVVTNYVPGTE
jgi:DNA adenine methylase